MDIAPSVAQDCGPAAAPSMRVHLLGTGGPELTPHRQGAATLIEACGHRLLFDAGRGVLQRLYESRIAIGSVHEVFLTHLHSDHIEGLPGLWMTGWFVGGRKVPMEIHGPEGTTAMTEGMKAMFGHDVRCRGGATPKVNLTHVDVREFAEGLVLDRDGLRVSAFQVEHCDGNPAFGFRVECEGASVVISGDTIYTENLVRHAQGASVVIHNVIAASEAYLASFPAKSRVLKKLASPEECAKAFMRIAPRLAVFTHVINLGTTVEALCERTRRAGYAGPLHVASDRTVIDLGREIVVHGPQPLDDLPDLTCPEDSSLLDCSGALGNAPALFTRLLA